MSKQQDTKLDIAKEVKIRMTGEKGFGNTGKLRKLGRTGYEDWLAGKLAQKAVHQQADPRRAKKLARKQS